MSKDYTPGSWDDEVLAGPTRYDIKEDGGEPIHEDVQISLATDVAVAGTGLSAALMNNIEAGVDSLDSFLRDVASELTISSGAIAVTKSRHKLQPESSTADDLETISGIPADTFLILYAGDPGTDVITLKHGTGNLSCFAGNDIELSHGFVICYCDGSTVFVYGGARAQASAAEINAGTNATKTINPDAFAASKFGIRLPTVQVLTADTAWTVGDGKIYFRIPAELAGFNVVSAGMSVLTKSTSGIPTLQIARGRQASPTSDFSFSDMLSTKLTIDENEFDSRTAATPAVIDGTVDDLAEGDLLRFDIDVAGTGTMGCWVTLGFQLP